MPREPAPKLNLYELARLNADYMRERYERVRDESSETTEIVERFCQRVERDGRVSINTKSLRLLSMLRNGYYPNPHDEARERARHEGGDSEDYLKQSQSGFYQKRVTFERSFVDGENFRYGALGIAGTGLAFYGLYCLVLHSPHGDDRLALLPANSLKRFMCDDFRMDTEALQREVAPWPNRHHLAAHKHAHEVPHCPESAWPTMMCYAAANAESFIEVILGSPVTPQHLAEIRFDVARLNELIAKLVDNTASASERTEMIARDAVFEELTKNNLDALYREV